jgi:hypothetical protein
MASHAVNFLTLSNVYGKEKETRNKVVVPFEYAVTGQRKISRDALEMTQ